MVECAALGNKGSRCLLLRPDGAVQLEFRKAAAGIAKQSAIRNYDPCISCATNVLKLKVERG